MTEVARLSPSQWEQRHRHRSSQAHHSPGKEQGWSGCGRRRWVPAAPWTAWRSEALLPGSNTPDGGRACRPEPYHLCHHQTPRWSTQAEKATEFVTTRLQPGFLFRAYLDMLGYFVLDKHRIGLIVRHLHLFSIICEHLRKQLFSLILIFCAAQHMIGFPVCFCSNEVGSFRSFLFTRQEIISPTAVKHVTQTFGNSSRRDIKATDNLVLS